MNNPMFQMYPNIPANPYAPQVPNTPTNHNGINWVQGIEGAKAYQLVPNSNSILMDSENDGIFYIKVSDNVGMCNLRTFRYEEITNAPVSSNIDLSGYVRKDELEQLVSSMIGVKNEQSISATKSKSNKTITE